MSAPGPRLQPQPIAKTLQADQFPVAGDEVWIKAKFRSIHHPGEVFVAIERSKGKPAQHIYVDGETVFASLRVGHVLETYGQ